MLLWAALGCSELLQSALCCFALFCAALALSCSELLWAALENAGLLAARCFVLLCAVLGCFVLLWANSELLWL